MPPIRLTNGKLQDLYARNPQFQVQTFDFNNSAALSQLAWGSSDREEILPLLKSYQRLLKLHPDERAADVLLARGFTSAQQIARAPERRFARELGPDLDTLDGGGDGARLALLIHRNARAVQTGTMLLATDAQLASQFVSMPPLAHLQGLIPFEESAPSYESLFGRNVYAVDEDAQTIFSPAAYFVDLSNLIDQYITQANAGSIPPGLTLQERRPDLWQIKLDSDSTYTELPYIEIVNQILESKLNYDLGEDPRKYVANAVYPFRLPANLPLEEIRAYLAPFKLTLAGIYQAYRVAKQQTARESLGLSLESYGLLSGAPSVLHDGTTTPTVADDYGLYESQTTDELSHQQFFLEKTGLTSQQLNDLIYQNTRHTPTEVTQANILSFDGVVDYGSCASSPSLQVAGDQTIELWLKASSLYSKSIFWKAADGEFALASDSSGALLYTFGPTGSFNASSDGQSFSIPSNAAPANEWIHVAVVRDWENKLLVGYVNGEAQAHGQIYISSIATSTDNVQIATGYWSKYGGQMAELRLWNIVRSREEIQADMRRRLTGREPGLAGYWPMSYITTGAQPRPVNQAAAKQAVEGMLNALAASGQSVSVTPAALLTGGMSQSQAQTLFDGLVAQGFIDGGGLVLHERPLSPESLTAFVTSLADVSSPVLSPPQDVSLVTSPPQGTSPVQPPSGQDTEANVAAHLSTVLSAYLAKQNGLVTKTLANSLRVTPAQVESAALLTELMLPSSLTFDGTDDYSAIKYSDALALPKNSLLPKNSTACPKINRQAVPACLPSRTQQKPCLPNESGYNPPLWTGCSNNSQRSGL
jgi:hypothetical protein